MSQYLTYQIERFYDCDEGKIAVPVAGDAEHYHKPVVVQTHCPITYLYISWTISKVGECPDLPSPKLFDQKSELLYRQYGTTQQGKTGEGDQIWSVSGIYMYVLDGPLGLTSAIPLGKQPWEPGSPLETTIPASAWKQGILDGRNTIKIPN